MINSIKKFLPPYIISLLRYMSRLRSERRTSTQIELVQKSKSLKNINCGKRVFIVGAGSSVSRQDLKKLRGEDVITVSNTFVHPDFSYMSPKYHVLPYLRYGHGTYKTDQEFSDWLSKMDKALGDAELVMHVNDIGIADSATLDSKRIVHWVDYRKWDGSFKTPINLSKIPYIWSVSEVAITCAVYMGYDEIYLIGFDHDWFNGPLVYFYDHNTQHELKPSEASLQQNGVDAEFQMRRHADIFKKYKYLYSIKRNIFNANFDPTHYLDVFPKVDYDSLF